MVPLLSRLVGDPVILNIAIVAVAVASTMILFRPKVANAITWRATTTPLASIIGSGFLVLGPILNASYGFYAPLVMAALCGVAYLFGSAIRFNIATLGSSPNHREPVEQVLETISSWSLAFAYVISVAYYLNLFGAFAVRLSPFDDPVYAKLVTTLVFCVILAVGWFRGFKMLERLEYTSVVAKLAIIAGLLVGLFVYFVDKTVDGALVLAPVKRTGWDAVTLAFGLLITVQGFETSRYLGAHYDVRTRIGSMVLAQTVTAAIYVTYILLLSYVFDPTRYVLTETAVIGMMHAVAAVLPLMLIAAALFAQFSAAIADTSGSGGLFAELTGNRLEARHGYALLVGVGLALTWTAHIFEIIGYASRSFAFYYALQALIASVSAFRHKRDRLRGGLFLLLAILGWMIVIFGQSIES
jgi:hypothetical protein